MHLSLQLWLIERYSKPGETILDPMAGSGTLMVACSMGRNVILVELEEKFCDMMRKNWEKVRQRGAQLGYQMGTCQIIRGDARQLEDILADKIISSPPFQEADVPRPGKEQSVKNYNYGTKMKHQAQSPENIAGLAERHYGDIDKVITSPPYEGSLQGKPSEERIEATARHLEESSIKRTGKFRYRHSPGDLKHFGIVGYGYSASPSNIGNLKSTSYLEAMLLVYQQCYKVLKPNGLMVLVVKPFIRNKKIVPLHEHTIQLAEKAGFKFVEQHYRKLTTQSFWRTIYHQRFPEVEPIDREYILVFKKDNRKEGQR